MTSMNCEQLTDVAPELALGVLTGRERADAFAHLDRCGSCRQLVSSLSGVTDELLRGFAPSVEPPVGFETRVLQAMTPRPRVRRRNAIAAFAAAACVALLVGIAVLLGGSRPAFAAAEMRTDSGEVVGWIYINDDSLAMQLPGWAEQSKKWGGASVTYSLRLVDESGTEHLLPVDLNGGTTWSADLEMDRITSAALVDASGHVWCQAELT
ncbi:MAG TPA: hypothetical protein VLD86_02515 [Ilumatobacteraceae bacterium]|nr:hypothetical protein [Ilumatobacteraceae bacterium]